MVTAATDTSCVRRVPTRSAKNGSAIPVAEPDGMQDRDEIAGVPLGTSRCSTYTAGSHETAE
jgi:hypothetical protein